MRPTCIASPARTEEQACKIMQDDEFARGWHVHVTYTLQLRTSKLRNGSRCWAPLHFRTSGVFYRNLFPHRDPHLPTGSTSIWVFCKDAQVLASVKVRNKVHSALFPAGEAAKQRTSNEFQEEDFHAQLNMTFKTWPILVAHPNQTNHLPPATNSGLALCSQEVAGGTPLNSAWNESDWQHQMEDCKPPPKPWIFKSTGSSDNLSLLLLLLRKLTLEIPPWRPDPVSSHVWFCG